ASWSNHKAARLGAALAYYSIFSLGPLLVIAVAVAGLTFRHEAVRGEVGAQLRALLGDAGAQAVNAMLLGASKPMEGILATVLGVGALMFAAVGVRRPAQGRAQYRLGGRAPQGERHLGLCSDLYGLACGRAFARISAAGVVAANERAGCWRQIHCALRAGIGDARAR